MASPIGPKKRPSSVSAEPRGRLKAMRKRGALAAKFAERRTRNAFAAMLFSRPLSFKTRDGKSVRILRHAFANPYIDTPGVKPRALVIVFVGKKRMFFYRSSGEASKMPGEWFPTTGIELDYSEIKPSLGYITKLEGHPFYGKRNPSFPFWVDEIRKMLKASAGRMTFHPDWGLKKYVEVEDALKEVPKVDALKEAKESPFGP